MSDSSLFGDKRPWTEEELHRLDELLSDLPARAAIAQFAAESLKMFGYKRTRGAVTTIYKRKKQFQKYRGKYAETPTYIPVFTLVNGLNTSKAISILG